MARVGTARAVLGEPAAAPGRGEAFRDHCRKFSWVLREVGWMFSLLFFLLFGGDMGVGRKKIYKIRIHPPPHGISSLQSECGTSSARGEGLGSFFFMFSFLFTWTTHRSRHFSVLVLKRKLGRTKSKGGNVVGDVDTRKGARGVYISQIVFSRAGLKRVLGICCCFFHFLKVVGIHIFTR